MPADSGELRRATELRVHEILLMRGRLRFASGELQRASGRDLLRQRRPLARDWYHPDAAHLSRLKARSPACSWVR